MEEWFYCNGYYASDNLKKNVFYGINSVLRNEE